MSSEEETTKYFVEETKHTPLPQKSKKKYELFYKAFMDWRASHNIDSFEESVFLRYFGELAIKYKSSSLWTTYSVIKSTVNANHNINIESFTKLRDFLKRKSEGYLPKKSKTFTSEEISKFINEAPDYKYLHMKVALIMGIIGACRSSELYLMSIQDIQDFGSTLLVTVSEANMKIVRKFTITGDFYEVCKKYIDCRPSNLEIPSLFLNYQHGKCLHTRIGINKIGAMGREIAEFLNLQEADKYTGHCFRRSSATLHGDQDNDITVLKKNQQWESPMIEHVKVEDVIKCEIETDEEVLRTVPESQSYFEEPESTSNSHPVINASPNSNIKLINCTNITINYITRCNHDQT